MKTSLTQAHIVAAIGSIGTAVVAIVPAWTSQEQVIVAALGGAVSSLYPLVTAFHRVADGHLAIAEAQSMNMAVTGAQAARDEAARVVPEHVADVLAERGQFTDDQVARLKRLAEAAGAKPEWALAPASDSR